jgi:hypothetical protein
MRLKEHERQQSGVKVILGELERRVEELVGQKRATSLDSSIMTNIKLQIKVG